MKYISYHILLLCILLLVLSQCISSCSKCCEDYSIFFVSEITHYTNTILKIKKEDSILINDPYYISNHRYRNYSSNYEYKYDGTMETFLRNTFEIRESSTTKDSFNYRYSYINKNNDTQYIETPMKSYPLSSNKHIDIKGFVSGFLFYFSFENPKVIAEYYGNTYIIEDDDDTSIFIHGNRNSYQQSNIPEIEQFSKSIKDTFNLIRATFGGTLYPNNIILLDTIKAINIYCNSDYNDKYKKGSLLNSVMKIAYFNHIPFIQSWYQKAIESNGTTTEDYYYEGDELFAKNNPDNFTEEWLEEFNAKANTNRLLHPEFLLLGTENPAEQGEYSFTIEFIYNTGKKIVQETPNFALLQEFYSND